MPHPVTCRVRITPAELMNDVRAVIEEVFCTGSLDVEGEGYLLPDDAAAPEAEERLGLGLEAKGDFDRSL